MHTDEPPEEPQINLTPLIDVVFVLLITFIVIAPILEFDRVELADSKDGPSEEVVSVLAASPIAIEVKSDDRIFFNQRQVSLEELFIGLESARSQHQSAKPQLFHDRKARFGTYQSVKNIVEKAGFSEMEVILNPA